MVASPRLVGRSGKLLTPVELGQFPLIDVGWPASDVDAPTWRHWEAAAQNRNKHVPNLSAAPELARGTFVKVANVTLLGYGFYILHRSRHPKLAPIKAFVAWALAVT